MSAFAWKKYNCYLRGVFRTIPNYLNSLLLLYIIIFITRNCYQCATDVLLPIPCWITKAIIVSIVNNLSFIRLLLLVSNIKILSEDCFYFYILRIIFIFEHLSTVRAYLSYRFSVDFRVNKTNLIKAA